MAIAVNAKISIDGGSALTDYHSISIRQELHAHHSFQVVVPYEMLEQDRTDGFFHQAHQRYCGKPISIVLTPVVATEYPPLVFKGVVTHLTLANSGDFSHSFVLSGFSPSYLLEDGMQRRTFRQKTLRAIFDEVLRPYPKNQVSLASAQPQHQEPLEYAVQYGESNFAFLRRLADAYGEWFYYDGQDLRLGRPADAAPQPFEVLGTEGFSLALELQPASFTMQRYDELTHKPYTSTSASQALTQLHPFTAVALQQSEALFSQPARLLANRHVRNQGELNTAVRAWKASQASNMVTFQGNGENTGFAIGQRISVQGGTAQARHNYGTYRLSEVNHLVQADQYQNSFVALPDAAQHPAAHTVAAAPLGVPELAEVIDVADPQHLGRLRVRFYWPVAKPAEAESGWLRVSTPYSGHGKGQLFTPEVGSQVLVGYEQAGADFPLVLGNLFHPQNPQKARYTTDANHLKGIQTAGGNKVVMSDKKGEQTILLSNSNNKGTAIQVSFKGDGSVHIKSRGPVTVTGANVTLAAGPPAKGQTAFTGEIKLQAKTITLDAEDDVKLTAKKKSIALNAKQDITGEAKENISFKAKAKSITTNDKLEISGGSNVSIKAGKVKINS